MRVRSVSWLNTDYLRSDKANSINVRQVRRVARPIAAVPEDTASSSSPHGSVDATKHMSSVKRAIRQHSDTWGSGRVTLAVPSRLLRAVPLYSLTGSGTGRPVN